MAKGTRTNFRSEQVTHQLLGRSVRVAMHIDRGSSLKDSKPSELFMVVVGKHYSHLVVEVLFS